MRGLVIRWCAASCIGVGGPTLAWWAASGIEGAPDTTIGGAHPVLLGLELVAAVAVTLAGALLIADGDVLAGALLTASGTLWLAPELSGVADLGPPARGIAGIAGALLLPAVAAACVLSVSRSRPRPRWWTPTAALLGVVVLLAASQLDPFLDPRCWRSCMAAPTALPALASAQPLLGWTATLAACASAVVALALLARSAVAALGTGDRGRVAEAVLGCSTSGLLLSCLALDAILRHLVDDGPDVTPFLVLILCAQVAAILLVAGTGWTRVGVLRQRRRIGLLVERLDAMRTPTSAATALAKAVREDDLEVAFRLPERDAWVDPNGRTVSPPPPSRFRAVTSLLRDGDEIARLTHSPRTDARAIEAAMGPALLLAMENARLQAAGRAELADLQASRRRIVERSDAERTAVERDLHDGAQQRVVSLLLLIGMLEADLDGADPALTRSVRQAAATASAVLVELRRIARGIAPPALRDAGLGAALHGFAETQRDLELTVSVPEYARFSAELDAATFLVVESAVLDAVRRGARVAEVVLVEAARRLRLEVRDDGPPSAERLVHSLADRVAVLDGQLTVSALDRGGRPGTRVQVEFPCA